MLAKENYLKPSPKKYKSHAASPAKKIYKKNDLSLKKKCKYICFLPSLLKSDKVIKPVQAKN